MPMIRPGQFVQVNSPGFAPDQSAQVHAVEADGSVCVFLLDPDGRTFASVHVQPDQVTPA